jgi:hypothetical protein
MNPTARKPYGEPRTKVLLLPLFAPALLCVWLAFSATSILGHTLQAGALSLTCPATVVGGDRMTFTLSGSGVAIIDAVEGGFPADEPNTTYAPDGDGGDTMVGTVPEAGSIDLVWLAPETDAERTVYLFATTEEGETPGQCEIRVLPTGSASEPTAEVAAPAATTTPVRPTRTPVPYNEVRGLPTSAVTVTPVSTITPSPTATVRQNATFAPTTFESGMVSAVIGPNGGSLGSSTGASIEIPAGALTEPVTVTIIPIPLSSLPAQTTVQLLPDSSFDITFALADGAPLAGGLLIPARFSLIISDGAGQPGIQLYVVDGVVIRAAPEALAEGGVLSATVKGFTRFVVGVPEPATVEGGGRTVQLIIAAVLGVIAMIAIVVIGGMIRPRRHRVITNRRSTRTRY